MQDEMDCYFAVADWHALTTNYDNPENIKENTRQLVIDWLSVGIDPSKSTMLVQSHNLAHAELYLLLGMMTPVAWLERNPSYKDIQQELANKELANYGFLGYPVLMTADIILYNANCVPVGVDQVPHVEIAREMVRRFHHLYNVEIFTEPQPILTKVSKLPGLDGRKMSKSYGNSIALSEPTADVDKKLRTMVTDTNRVRKTDVGNPAICPAFEYHKVFSTEAERAEITQGCTTATMGCIDCKKILINHVQALLEPIREKRAQYEREITDVAEFLSDSQARANAVAEETMAKVRAALKV
jgi:tryptophanyl-tRNA synthetase